MFYVLVEAKYLLMLRTWLSVPGCGALKNLWVSAQRLTKNKISSMHGYLFCHSLRDSVSFSGS